MLVSSRSRGSGSSATGGAGGGGNSGPPNSGSVTPGTANTGEEAEEAVVGGDGCGGTGQLFIIKWWC